MKKWDRLVVVSNRLPITISETNGIPMLQTSDGGLVSALIPTLREMGGTWVGWTGTDYSQEAALLVTNASPDENYDLEPVFLTTSERAASYRGFSNEIIWPLFHGLPSRCLFEGMYWDSYCEVNEKFADAVEHVSGKQSLIWIHDYHLMVLGRALRSRGMRQQLGYFHHIPFPASDIFEALPWRADVLRSLLEFDVIGFQTPRDCRNFIGCVERLLPNAQVSYGDRRFAVRASGHTAHASVYPISVDYRDFETLAADDTVQARARRIKADLRAKIILGVDRLDYTKGIPERLTAFEKLLESHPELRGHVTMVQVVVPSRAEISEYDQLRLQIETLVGKINGRYSNPGWTPVRYFYRSLPKNELAAFYLAADIALLTPLRDGMNLVAKEFCASRIDGRGVLILSEFAGAAEELKRGALIVNPHDTRSVACAIDRSLHMEESEQTIRLERMRSHIAQNDVYHWARSFMNQFSLEHAVAVPA